MPTVFEKMTRSRPLPDEPYDTMYQDGYTPYEIVETARNAILKHHAEAEANRAAASNSSLPMNVNINSEIRLK